MAQVGPRLPQEVVERIIDYVTGPQLLGVIALIDKIGWQALLNCALTCRAWLPRSVYYLDVIRRKDISIRGSDQFQELSRALVASDTGLELFLRCRSMSLDGDHGHVKRWIHAVPLVLGARRLSNINNLEVSRCNWATYTPHPLVFSFGFSAFVSVTTLQLEDCDFGTFHQFINLVGALSALASLKIVDCTSYKLPSSGMLLQRIAPSLPLSYITYGLTSHDLAHEKRNIEFGVALATWLSSSPSAHLQTWDLEFSSGFGQSAMLVNLVRAVGTAMRNVKIDLIDEHELNLSALHHPSKMELRFIQPRFGVGRALSRYLLDMLRTLPDGSALRHLRIEVHEGDTRVPTSREDLQRWQEVTDVLDRLRVPRLANVELMIVLRSADAVLSDYSIALDELEAASSRLWQRGVTVHLRYGRLVENVFKSYFRTISNDNQSHTHDSMMDLRNACEDAPHDAHHDQANGYEDANHDCEDVSGYHKDASNDHEDAADDYEDMLFDFE